MLTREKGKQNLYLLELLPACGLGLLTASKALGFYHQDTLSFSEVVVRAFPRRADLMSWSSGL